mmetsp:Transcript_12137/g.31093  ORF Transcript_12137/g.31093 Transcript_12137/m.31093 type:complete len:209 (+) Transcript_12137:142-768(+)
MALKRSSSEALMPESMATLRRDSADRAQSALGCSARMSARWAATAAAAAARSSPELSAGMSRPCVNASSSHAVVLPSCAATAALHSCASGGTRGSGSAAAAPSSAPAAAAVSGGSSLMLRYAMWLSQVLSPTYRIPGSGSRSCHCCTALAASGASRPTVMMPSAMFTHREENFPDDSRSSCGAGTVNTVLPLRSSSRKALRWLPNLTV